MIPVYSPFLTAAGIEYTKRAINSGWVSSNGAYLEKTTTGLLSLTKQKYVLLTNCGTAANHLMAIGLRYKYPKIKNLIVPNNVYVAAWNQFLVNPKFKLIPVDCSIRTWNICGEELEGAIEQSSPEDTAILIVHNLGNIVNVPKLKEKYPDYVFLEDNCEGFLGEYEGAKSGTASLMSSVSFYGNKIITSGEGGALFTDDEGLYLYLDSVRCQGSTDKKFIFNKLGYNYRMTNVEAAMLYGQILYLDEVLKRKDRVFSLYRELLPKDFFQEEEEGTRHSNWMMGINTCQPTKRLAKKLLRVGIETRPMFYPMSKHRHLRKFARDEEGAKVIAQNSIILPSSPLLTDKEVIYICNKVKDLI